MKNRMEDEKIRRVMNSLSLPVPEELDAGLEEMIRTGSRSRDGWIHRIPFFLKWSPAAAAALFFVILGLSGLKRPAPEEPPIRELRIQYEMKEQNIKILWVKKEGFILKRRDK